MAHCFIVNVSKICAQRGPEPVPAGTGRRTAIRHGAAAGQVALEGPLMFQY